MTSADYEGPNSTFSSGRTTGYGTLDALRATLNFNGTGIDKSKAKVAQAGYSGGAISTGALLVLAALRPQAGPPSFSRRTHRTFHRISPVLPSAACQQISQLSFRILTEVR